MRGRSGEYVPAMDQEEAGRAAERLLYEIPEEMRQAFEERDLEAWVTLSDEQRTLELDLRAWIQANQV